MKWESGKTSGGEYISEMVWWFRFQSFNCHP